MMIHRISFKNWPSAVKQIIFGTGAVLILLSFLTGAISSFRLWGGFPGSGISHSRLGNQMWRQGKTEQARREFEKAIKIEPLDFSSLVKLAKLREQAGNSDQALSDLRRALEISGINAEVFAEIAAIHHRRGEIQESISALSAAIEISAQCKFGISHSRHTLLPAK